jgi:shikimate 5-dehydrogenase
MRRTGDHAVALGPGGAGLPAARVVADAYERVAVVNRDALAHRRSTPVASPHELEEVPA